MAADLDVSLKKFWRGSLLLAAISGWLTVAALLSTPSEAGRALLFGYSAQRLAMVGVAFLLAALFSLAAFQTNRQPELLERLIARTQALLGNQAVFSALSALAALLLILCWLGYFLPQDRAIELLGAPALYLAVLKPLLAYGLLFSLVTLTLLLASKFGLDADAVKGSAALLRPAGWLLAAMLLLAAFIRLSGIGSGFDLTQWNAPGAPLLSSQVFIVVMVALLLALAAAYLLRRMRASWVDVGLFLFIWLAAASLWMATPAEANYYSSAPLPPNAEHYPLSDAFNHDVIANNLLIGEDFRFGGLRAIRKPLYAAFLAGLHLVSGSDYARLIDIQVLLLALFPAVLFLLGRRLHSRLAGLLLAGLVTLREANAIFLGDVINLSHAKLLMADLPAALALAALALLVVKWLRDFPRSAAAALLAGGLLGFLLLLRSQQLTIIPAIALLALLALRAFAWSWKVVTVRVTLFLLGAALAAAPWLLRNKSLTGEFIIEQSTAASYLAERYSEDPASVETAFLPGESEGEYYARHMQLVRSYAFSHPGETLTFVADNYLRNLTLTVMPLPLSLQLRGLEAHVRQLPYWPSWDGALLPESWLPLGLSLAFIALGLAAAWRKLGWAGLVPLAINLGFTVSLALARVSGWRYNQPVDWTLMLYFAIGVAQVLVWLFALFGKRMMSGEEQALETPSDPLQISWRPLGLAALLVLAVGLSPLALETLTPPRYQAVSREQAEQWLAGYGESEAIGALLESGDLRLLTGRALHPRYLGPGVGDIENEFALTQPQDYAHLSFFLVGPTPTTVYQPYQGDSLNFPSGSDVLVFACPGQGLNAAATLVLDEGRAIAFYSSAADLSQVCDGL